MQNKMDVRVSGPTAIRIIEYNGKKYIFFDDRHIDNSRLCENCIEDPNCLDIIQLMENIFIKNEKHKLGTQLFLETGFQKGKTIISKGWLGGVLGQIYNHFHDCFNKTPRCKFKNTLFHYTDIRKVFLDPPTKEGREEVLLLDTPGYIMRQIDETVTKHKEGVYNDKHIKQLIHDLYFDTSDGETLAYKIFQTCLISDDFINDIMKLVIELPMFDNIMKEMIILRAKRGKKMVHKSRAQLLALVAEGKQDLAIKIGDFLLNGYKEILELVKNRFLNKIMELEKIDEEGLNSIYSTTGTDLHTLGVLIMDSYTLPRMFRDFTTNYGYKMHTTLVYAGGFHTYIYWKFFETLGAKSIFYDEVKNESNQPMRCVNIKYEDYVKMLY